MWTVPTEELQVFSYTVNPPDLSTLCPNWVKCHSRLNNPDELHPKPEEVPRDLFAAIWGEAMHLYDLKTGETTHHSLPMYVYSGYVQVDRTTVLIVGEQVRTLDLLTLQTTPLPPLLTPRDFVGVAQMGSTVFAFGGIDGTPLKVCEKSSVPPTHWTPLPPMHYARSNFTPCAFKAFLYLVSAKNHRAVESFSSHNETFTVLPVSLPAYLSSQKKSLFIFNKSLEKKITELEDLNIKLNEIMKDQANMIENQVKKLQSSDLEGKREEEGRRRKEEEGRREEGWLRERGGKEEERRREGGGREEGRREERGRMEERGKEEGWRREGGGKEDGGRREGLLERRVKELEELITRQEKVIETKTKQFSEFFEDLSGNRRKVEELGKENAILGELNQILENKSGELEGFLRRVQDQNGELVNSLKDKQKEIEK